MRVRALPIADRIADGGESVVMVGPIVVWLSPIATAILNEIDTWTDMSDLAASLERTLGTPVDGDTTTLVAEAVASLADQRLLEYE